MKTECISPVVQFQANGKRQVEAAFDGGKLSSDGGLLLLRELDERIGLIDRFSKCFMDLRNPDYVEHSLHSLVGQRVFAIALGYEDLNDHDDLRRDPLLAMACGKEDTLGVDRARKRDEGCPLDGKSTLNRMELSASVDSMKNRYKKILLMKGEVEKMFLEVFAESFRTPPASIIIDVDATDDPVHGEQEGRFFSGYYKEYCYLPLYIFSGDHLLLARLQTADVDPATDGLDAIRRTVLGIRELLPGTRIVLRGDGGFCRQALMTFCEETPMVEFLFGLPKNKTLERLLAPQMEEAAGEFGQKKETARIYAEFQYSTKDTWGRERRVVGKAEHGALGANPRFVVTSLEKDAYDPQDLHWFYCQRGDMENRIKEQQLGLFADRTSSSLFKTNQLRLWFSSVAYTLMRALREHGLKGTSLEKAQCWTIRTRLLKLAVRILVSVRRVKVSMPTVHPGQEMFHQIARQIQSVPMRH
jgi:hypothetical protein